MLDWFTTIPGILIICGIVLLVIAIILFLVGAKKEKKVANNDQMDMNSMSGAPSMDTMDTSLDANSDISVASITPEVTVEEVAAPEVSEVSFTAPTVDNEVTPPVVDIPVEIEEEKVEIPAVDTTVISTDPVMPEFDSAYSEPETPSFSFPEVEATPVKIYGGNDPLEATQTLPKMEEHHEPYSGNYSEAKVEAVSELVTPEVKVEEPIIKPIETPEVTPIVDNSVNPVEEAVVEENTEEVKTSIEEL